MFDKARSFAASHHDASELVKQAEKFSVRLPLVGRVGVPPPDQLAFFGVLGGLAVLGAIEWPVAAAIGVGQVVVARHFGDAKPAEETRSSPPQKAVAATPPVKKAPARAAAKTAPAKKAAAKKSPAKKAPAKKASGSTSKA